MLPGSKDNGVSSDMSWKITVHDFVAAGDTLASRKVTQLEQGHDLASVCARSNRWMTPRSTIDPSVFVLCHDKLYQYRFNPPSLTPGTRATSIPEWGQPSRADDCDHLRLQDLQEFESTDFQTCLIRSRLGLESSRHEKRVQEDGLGINERAKRRRFEKSSIWGLIPQPHFIPGPAANFQPVDTGKIPPYRKAQLSPIAPYDAAAVNQLLGCRFRRAAWLVPVRGSLPWDGVSSAVILEDTQVTLRSPSPSLPIPVTQHRAITWTADSLRHFWTFLRSIQQAKHLGPLSLSFHAAPDAFAAKDTMSEPLWESNHPYYPRNSSKDTAGSSDDFATDICRSHLEGIDYIKVYHDVPYSLSLRNVLDAYRYEPANGEVPGRSGANDRKIRVLKGAHLAFMDEHSKAAFLM